MTRLAAVTAAGIALLAGCGTGDDDKAALAGRLAPRTVEAGAVTVKVTPVRIDDRGASFEVAFDTHSVDLDLDVAGAATLTVGGAPWSSATWDGAGGPDGHHREGMLRFDPAGAATGTVELTIDGLPAPVQASWTLEDD